MVTADKNQSPPSETREFMTVFSAASFLNDFGSDMIYPIWPLFVTVYLGANVVVLGFIDGLGDAIVSISLAGSGCLSDKVRKRKIFVWIGYLFGAEPKSSSNCSHAGCKRTLNLKKFCYHICTRIIFSLYYSPRPLKSLPNRTEKMKTQKSAAIAQIMSWVNSRSIKKSTIEKAKRRASTINHLEKFLLPIQSP